MRFLTQCYDFGEGDEECAVMEIDADLAKTILKARSRVLELKKEEGLEQLVHVVLHAHDRVKYFEMSALGEEGVDKETNNDPEMLPDKLTKEQRLELINQEFTVIADDLKLYDEDSPPPPHDSIFRWTDCDTLVVTEEIFYFTSYDGSSRLETYALPHSALSRVL